jgi:hypothetical protein
VSLIPLVGDNSRDWSERRRGAQTWGRTGAKGGGVLRLGKVGFGYYNSNDALSLSHAQLYVLQGLRPEMHDQRPRWPTHCQHISGSPS